MTVLAAVPAGRAYATPPQPPKYRVTDIVDLAGAYVAVSPNDPEHGDGTIGINNKGQIVYSRVSSGHRHAFVWLPETEYGFTGSAVYTIDSTGNSSVARDINEAGLICGYSAANREATVWTPNSGSFVSSSPLSPRLLGTDFSEANALNNDDPPQVVGYRTFTDECGSHTNLVVEGFDWTATDSGVIVAVGDRVSDGRHALLLTPVGCPWDVNFDCNRDMDDYEAITTYAGQCGDPCPCEGSESFSTSSYGSDLDRFTAMMASVTPLISEERAALAWTIFLNHYNN